MRGWYCLYDGILFTIIMVKTKHIIYTTKSGVKSTLKDWTFSHAEDVLKRAGVSYYEIGINTENRYSPYKF